MRRDERRKQLLETATQVIRDGGIQALTMERVAEQAGISKPVLYSHFANRNEVLLALIEDYWADIDASTRKIQAGATTFEERTDAIVEAYFGALARKGNTLHTLIFRNSNEPVLVEARRVREGRIEAVWAADYERDLGMPADVAAAAAAVVRSAIAGAGEYYLLHKGVSRQLCINVCRAVVHSALTNLAPEPAVGRKA